MWIQRVTLITRKGVLSSICQVKRMYVFVYVPAIRFKSNRVVYSATMQGLVEDDIYVSHVGIPISTEGMLVISGSVHGA